MIDRNGIYIKLYAIISSIEDDITDGLLNSPEALICQTNLQPFCDSKDIPNSIIESTLSEKIVLSEKLNKGNYGKHNESALVAVKNIVDIRNRVFHRKPLEYNDYESTIATANTLKKKCGDIFPKTVTTIKLLNDNEVEFLKSVNASFEEDQSIIHNLPQADFYETGYIGRTKLRKSLLKDIISGAYPVVTIVGEGGLGKTALALITAYDVTQHPNNPFELVLWTTAKRTKLIGFEIERSDSALSSGYDVLTAIRNSFDSNDRTGARESVIDLLSQLRTLLIIDNLETVLDDDLRWLGKSVPPGSKVLFTSRVQLGAGDKPVKMEPMSPVDARLLYKAFAGSTGQRDQAALTNSAIDEILGKLNHNPLFIKWYLQAIKSGASPSQVLQKRDVIIDFCMENVFDDLSRDELTTLGAVLATKPPRHFPKLAAVAKLNGEKLEDALSSLIRRNIITQTVTDQVTIYDISMLSKSFATKKKLIRSGDLADYKRNERVYLSEIAQMELSGVWSYNPKDVHIDREENFSAYRKVKSAGVQAARGEYQTALKKLNEAKHLSPKYFEIYRLEGWVHYNLGDYLNATESFETAISLAPDNPAIRYFYVDFLIRSEDFDQAVEQAKFALSIDPGTPALTLSLARALTYIGNLEDAWKITVDLDIHSLPAQTARIFADRLVDILARQIEAASKAQDWHSSANLLHNLREKISSIPSRHLDRGVRSKILKQKYWIRQTYRKLAVASRNQDDFEFLSSFCGEDLTDNKVSGGRARGTIKNFDSDKKYGFICDELGTDHFFHFNNCVHGLNIADIRRGETVSFSIGSNDQGDCADQVEILK